MAGRGPAAKDPATRRPGSKKPTHEWVNAGGEGWQYGDVPPVPTKLTKAAREAWEIWMGSWFAWFWGPEDLPALRQLVRLYDQVERGEYQRHAELRIAMDTYGITPKGQAERRWRPMSGEMPDLGVSPAGVTSIAEYRAAVGGE